MESSEIKSYQQKMKSLEKKAKKIETELDDAKNKLSKLSKQKENEQKKLQEKQNQFEKTAEQHLRERIREERTGIKSVAKANLEDDKETENVITIIIKAREECQIECEKIDSESKETQALIKELEPQIEETWRLWRECFYRAYPDKRPTISYHTYTDSYSSGHSYSSSDSIIGYSYNSLSRNDPLEETLRRDREARFKHDEEMRKREERARKEEAERRRIEEVRAHHAQMRRDSEERREKDRGLRHQCNTCRLSAKCYMRGSYPCPTYTPR